MRYWTKPQTKSSKNTSPDMEHGILHLLPIPMGSDELNRSIPHDVLELTKNIKVFACENIKTTRRYLKKIDKSIDIDALTFIVFNKKSNLEDTSPILKYLKEGVDVGVISEAGCPAVADPGNLLVARAHHEGFRIQPYVGPNSILLTLMSSGLNGQNFAFLGYAPIDKHEKNKWIRKIWNTAEKENQTQLFMETPYRNNAMMEALLEVLPDHATVAVGVELTTDHEITVSKKVKEWKKEDYDFHKKPMIIAVGVAPC